MNYKDAFHKMVHAYPGGIEALAMRMGMTPGVLRNKANPNSTTNVLSADDLFLACSITGDYRPIEAFCAQLGLACTKIDEQPAGDFSIVESTSNIWSKMGGLGQQVHSSLADGKMERHEAEAIEARAFELFCATMQLVSRSYSMCEKAGA